MLECNTWPGWECVRQLGAGSFGKVYEIHKKEFGKTFSAALKVITIPQGESELQDLYSEGMDEQNVTEYFESFVKDITEEFALMSSLKGHTNIVSYEDHMVVPHNKSIGWDVLIRMELLHPLKSWVTNNAITERNIIKLGCDICHALEICHKNSIVHRDIKPENIFINNNGDFKLGDFGIARTVDRTISNLSKKGTYTYMAPEVYLGNPYGKTSDIYSLGTVLYQYLNNLRTPFLPMERILYTDREIALSKRMSGENVPEPLNGSPQLKAVILKSIAFAPEERFSSASEFLTALEVCLNFAKDDVILVPKNNSLKTGTDEANIDKVPGVYPSFQFSQTKKEVLSGSAERNERVSEEYRTVVGNAVNLYTNNEEYTNREQTNRIKMFTSNTASESNVYKKLEIPGEEKTVYAYRQDSDQKSQSTQPIRGRRTQKLVILAGTILILVIAVILALSLHEHRTDTRSESIESMVEESYSSEVQSEEVIKEMDSKKDADEKNWAGETGESKSMIEPETQSQTEPETEPQTEPETEPQTEPETEPQTEPETEPQTEPETQPQTAPETQPTIKEPAQWSEWTTSLPNGITSSNYDIEAMDQYRYRYEGSQDWSEWGGFDTIDLKSPNVLVDIRTLYRYREK